MLVFKSKSFSFYSAVVDQMVRVNFPAETLDIGFNQHGMRTKAVEKMVEMMKDEFKAPDTQNLLTAMLETINNDKLPDGSKRYSSIDDFIEKQKKATCFTETIFIKSMAVYLRKDIQILDVGAMKNSAYENWKISGKKHAQNENDFIGGEPLLLGFSKEKKHFISLQPSIKSQGLQQPSKKQRNDEEETFDSQSTRENDSTPKPNYKLSRKLSGSSSKSNASPASSERPLTAEEVVGVCSSSNSGTYYSAVSQNSEKSQTEQSVRSENALHLDEPSLLMNSASVLLDVNAATEPAFQHEDGRNGAAQGVDEHDYASNQKEIPEGRLVEAGLHNNPLPVQGNQLTYQSQPPPNNTVAISQNPKSSSESKFRFVKPQVQQPITTKPKSAKSLLNQFENIGPKTTADPSLAIPPELADVIEDIEVPGTTDHDGDILQVENDGENFQDDEEQENRTESVNITDQVDEASLLQSPASQRIHMQAELYKIDNTTPKQIRQTVDEARKVLDEGISDSFYTSKLKVTVANRSVECKKDGFYYCSGNHHEGDGHIYVDAEYDNLYDARLDVLKKDITRQMMYKNHDKGHVSFKCMHKECYATVQIKKQGNGKWKSSGCIKHNHTITAECLQLVFETREGAINFHNWTRECGMVKRHSNEKAGTIHLTCTRNTRKSLIAKKGCGCDYYLKPAIDSKGKDGPERFEGAWMLQGHFYHGHDRQLAEERVPKWVYDKIKDFARLGAPTHVLKTFVPNPKSLDDLNAGILTPQQIYDIRRHHGKMNYDSKKSEMDGILEHIKGDFVRKVNIPEQFVKGDYDPSKFPPEYAMKKADTTNFFIMMMSDRQKELFTMFPKVLMIDGTHKGCSHNSYQINTCSSYH